MRLLAGLGNPGAKYAKNRHNVGFMAIDAIAAANPSIGPERARFQSAAREGVIETGAGPKRVLLLKPQTYYNESGRAVGEAARFFKIPPEEIVVFHDELDLAPGKFRTKAGGGAAGNNGIKSITAALGAGFMRCRIGVGHPGARDQVTGWVLSDFYKADLAWLEPLLDAVGRASDLLAAGDWDAFQTRVTHLAPAPKPVKPPSDDASEH